MQAHLLSYAKELDFVKDQSFKKLKIMNSGVESLIGILNKINLFSSEMPISYFCNRHVTASLLLNLNEHLSNEERRDRIFSLLNTLDLKINICQTSTYARLLY